MLEYLQNQFYSGIAKSIRGLIRGLLKSLIFALVGASLLSMGAIFIWLGVYEYLLKFLAKEAAWILVGALSIILGLVLIVAASPRRR
ncbi:MAG: hypothetical protein QW390_00080 [Candidatus Bathyarchaeia archaeon]